MYFLLLICCSALVLLYGWHVFLLDLLLNRQRPPGPMPWPFIGSFIHVLLATAGKKRPPQFWQIMKHFSEKYGSIFTFYLGQLRFVVLNDSKIIHEALVEKAETFSWRIDNYIPGFQMKRSGLIALNYDEWRQNRRFSMRAMRDFGMGKAAMVTKIQDEIVHFLPELEARTNNGQPFNPRHLIEAAVSNIICNLVFGKRFNYGDEKLEKLLHLGEVIVSRSVNYSLPFLMVPSLRHFLVPIQVKDVWAFQKATAEMALKAIEEHRQDFDPENIRDFPDVFLLHEKKGGDAIDLDTFCLLMSDMFAAGSETTSTALAWTLVYLCTYPEIQQKCHQVIDDVIGDSANRMPDLNDRPRLVYIDAVMCEVLRHASFTPFAILHSNLENKGQIANFDIPPYTVVQYNIAAVHHDEAYWGDPEVFRPERFIGKDQLLLNHSGHFMPFGLGPRVCLGEALARVEYFIFIVSMLHRFRFSLKKPVNFDDVKHGVVVGPPSFEIKLHHR